MNYGSRIANMLGEIVSIKKNVDKKNYEEFNEKLDKLRKAGHHLQHSVYYETDGTFTIELLGEPDLQKLDKILFDIESNE